MNAAGGRGAAVQQVVDVSVQACECSKTYRYVALDARLEEYPTPSLHLLVRRLSQSLPALEAELLIDLWPKLFSFTSCEFRFVR